MKSFLMSVLILLSTSTLASASSQETLVVYRRPSDQVFSYYLSVRNGEVRKTLYDVWVWLWEYVGTPSPGGSGSAVLPHYHMASGASGYVPYELTKFDDAPHSKERHFLLQIEQKYCTVTDQLVFFEISSGWRVDNDKESYKSILLDFNREKSIELKVIFRDI